MDLQLYLEDIKRSNFLHKKASYNPRIWQNCEIKSKQIRQIIKKLLDTYSNGISRRDIISHLSNSKNLPISGFILTMIWGHGYSDDGRNDNRGGYKLEQCILKSKNIGNILEDIGETLNYGDIQNAYLKTKELKNFGISFISKYLYFLGRSSGMKNYPLIFDSRVAFSILKSNGANEFSLSLVKVQPRDDVKTYLSYLNYINELANKYNVPAENIEFFLFNHYKRTYTK